MNPKNVLFILVDCLRCDKVLEKRSSLPTFDRLMGKGITFTKMISTTSTTIPCVASIFTGVYPVIHNVRVLGAGPPYEQCVTLPGLLRKAGYHTYAEVTGPLIKETKLFTDFEHHSHRPEESTVYTEWGENFIDRVRRKEFQQPWFIFVHLWELHRPRAIKKEFDKRKYGKNRYERALSSLDSYLGQLVDNTDGVVIVHGDHGERIEDTLLTKIRSTLSSIPPQKGSSPKRMKGPFFEVGHGYNVYDFLVNPPFILYNTGTPCAKMIKTPVSQIDILPTLLDILGLPLNSVKDRFQGISLVPLITGGSLEERPLFMETCGSITENAQTWKVGVRTEKYKYIYSPFFKEGADEFYDLVEDPGETQNIVEYHRDKAAQYRTVIETEYLGTREKDMILHEIKRLKTLGNM
jgi:arylsulfatase A-like enzyme